MNYFQTMNPLVWHRKQIGLALIVLLALVSARPLWRALAAAGDLDTSFSGDGQLQLTSNYGPISSPQRIAIQHDGKLLALSSAGGFNGTRFELYRLNLDGEYDTTFSYDGLVSNINSVTTDYTINDASDLAIQFNGRIIIVGTHQYPYSNGLPRLTIRRFLPDGNADSSFANAGVQFGANNTSARSVAIQSNGKILVAGKSNAGGSAGPFIARFNSDGSLDTSFGLSGYLIVSDGLGTGEFTKIAVQSDEKILAASANGLRRYSASGQLDTTFGVNGIAAGNLNDFELLSNGKLIVLVNGNTVQRRLATGLLDTTFNETTLSCPNCGNFTSIVIQENGRILVGANGLYEYPPTILTRLNSNGSLDTTFGSGGYRESFGAFFNDVALMADQRIVTWCDRSHYPLSDYGILARYKNDNTGIQTTDVSVGPITISPTTVNPGDTVTYTIPVKNLSANKAAHVTMKTNVPSGTTYIGTSVPSGWAVLQQPNSGATGTVSASAYELAPGATANLFMVVKVPTTAAHGSTVSMSATVSNTIADSQPFNNTAYKVINVQ